MLFREPGLYLIKEPGQVLDSLCSRNFKDTLAGIGVDTSSATNANELVKNMARL